MKSRAYAIFALLPLLTPSIFAEEVRSDLALGVYASDVNEDAIAGSPQWSDPTRDPPLTMISAIRTATAKLKTLPANDQPVKWILQRVALKRASETGWYYIVTFRSKYVPDPPDGRGRVESGSNPYLTPRDLHIPVLMNGVVPKISVKRHTDAMLELLEDLSM